jgi:hypothetical protein
MAQIKNYDSKKRIILIISLTLLALLCLDIFIWTKILTTFSF